MSKPEFITVAIAPPGRLAYARTITNTLESLQEIVGGWIEMVHQDEFTKRGWHIYLNEEGKIMGLPPNRLSQDRTDLFVGTLVVSATDSDGEEIGLGDQADAAVELLNRGAMLTPSAWQPVRLGMCYNCGQEIWGKISSLEYEPPRENFCSASCEREAMANFV